MGQRQLGDSIHSARISSGHLLWPVGEPRPPAEWCDASALASSAGVREGGRGRGTTLYFDIDGRTLVLRQYRRGGMVRRLGDRYLRLGLRRSRAWRELALLVRLHREGLPVPRPVAARVEPVRPGSPFARQSLLMEHLPDTCTLAELLRADGAGMDAWQRIGAVIARMHVAGVDHADLNAHNILLDDVGAVYLIDFDRGCLRGAPGNWQDGNIERLRRSLDKLAEQESRFAFREPDWQWLEDGYRNELDRAST